MKAQPLLLALTLLLPALALSGAPPAKSAAEQAKSLNRQAKQSLGVSVRALAYLFEADPGTVHSMRSASLQRSWRQLESLERAGLVKLHKFGGPGADYLRIELTPKGEAVARELHGP